MLEIRPSDPLAVPSFASRTVNVDVDLGALAIRYIFSTTITDADPGDGVLRLSATQQNTALTIRADTLDVNGADVADVLDAFDDSTSTTKGHLRIYQIGDPNKWLLFRVTAIADAGGYRNIAVENIGSSATSPFEDGDSVLLSFTPAGERGSTELLTEVEITDTYIPILADADIKAKFLSDPIGVAVEIPPDVFPLRTTLSFVQFGDGPITFTGGAGVDVNPSARLTNVSAGLYSFIQAYQYATNEWILIGGLASTDTGYRLGSQQIFSTAGAHTWTKPVGCVAALARVVGGGGGGGGSADTTASGNACAGGGGGGEGLETPLVTSGLGPTETVQVGAGGAGGTAGANAGSAGGTSNFGAHGTALGGGGGTGSAASGSVLLNTGGTGGTGGTGAGIRIKGSAGGNGVVSSGIRMVGGFGGASMLGGSVGQTTNAPGTAGQAYGGGGSGATSAGAAARAGGAGAPGVVIVDEYY